MNAPMITGVGPTMSSLEIAELLESRHDKVKQSMERLAERGVITLSPLGEVSNPGPGPKTISVYRVEKRDSYVIVAQLSPEFTARLVDRWQDLEAQRSIGAFGGTIKTRTSGRFCSLSRAYIPRILINCSLAEAFGAHFSLRMNTGDSGVPS